MTDNNTWWAEHIEAIESSYEFMLAYAAQGRENDGTGAGSQIREYLTKMNAALEDVVSTAALGDKIKWHENDGTPDAGWTTTNVETSVDKSLSVFVADIDTDGYMDIVSAAYNDDEIEWYDTAIPEFPNIMMPIVSVLAIVGFHYRRR